MAKKDETIPPETLVLPPPVTPSQGGSYQVDADTGEHILIERTQPKEQA